MRKWVTAGGLKLKKGGVPYKWFKANKAALYGWFKPKPKPVPPAPGKNLTMYDDINLPLIPRDAEAVAGYVGGRWPTYPQVVKRWPKAKHLSIAINASENADCLDIERFDATPAQAPAWVKRQHARGKARPVLYTSASQMQALVDLMTKNGFVYGKDYLLWSAHYIGKPHFCGPSDGFGIKVTAHATQYWDKALDKSLDISICSPGFFA